MTRADRFGLVDRREMARVTGLELLRGIVAGTYPMPPIFETARMRLVEAEEGRVVFEGETSPGFLNPVGTIHGGWAATILDSAMACAVFSMTRVGETSTTVEMKLNYLRPLMPETGRLRCEGKTLHRGRAIATSEGRLVDEHGRLVAHGTETCMMLGM